MEGIYKQLGDVDKSSLPLHNFCKGSARRREKSATAAKTDGWVATAPSAQPLIGTKWSEPISDALKFPAPIYTLILQLQSYLKRFGGIMLGLLVDIESSDEGSEGGRLVTSTRLLRQSQGAILMRILLPEVPGLFSPSSSGVHDVTIRLQHLSAINVVKDNIDG